MSTKANVSFNLPICCNPNIIPDVDEPKSLISRTDAQNQSLYHTARALNKILAQEAETKEAWM